MEEVTFVLFSTSYKPQFVFSLAISEGHTKSVYKISKWVTNLLVLLNIAKPLLKFILFLSRWQTLINFSSLENIRNSKLRIFAWTSYEEMQLKFSKVSNTAMTIRYFFLPKCLQLGYWIYTSIYLPSQPLLNHHRNVTWTQKLLLHGKWKAAFWIWKRWYCGCFSTKKYILFKFLCLNFCDLQAVFKSF